MSKFLSLINLHESNIRPFWTRRVCFGWSTNRESLSAFSLPSRSLSSSDNGSRFGAGLVAGTGSRFDRNASLPVQHSVMPGFTGQKPKRRFIPEHSPLGRLDTRDSDDDDNSEYNDEEYRLQLAALDVLIRRAGDDPFFSDIIDDIVGNDDDEESFDNFISIIKKKLPGNADLIDKFYDILKDKGYFDDDRIMAMVKEIRRGGDLDEIISEFVEGIEDGNVDSTIKIFDIDEIVNESVDKSTEDIFNQDAIKSVIQTFIDDDSVGKYYWNESQYDDSKELEASLDDSVEQSNENVTNLTVETKNSNNIGDWVEKTVDLAKIPKTFQSSVEKNRYVDAVDKEFFGPKSDVTAYAQVDEVDDDSDEDDDDENYVKVTPLKQGPSDSFLGFLRDMEKHPTMYAQVDFENVHPESGREPKPDFPKHRLNPPKQFVESFSRFVYVCGLPPLEIEGIIGDLNNPNHRSIVENVIAGLARTETWKVYAASLTSGFVGLESEEERFKLFESGPSRAKISTGASVSKWNNQTHEGGKEFFNLSPDTTLLVQGIPPHNNATSLSHKLQFIDQGNLSAENFYILSETSCLVRLSSKDMAEYILQSDDIRRYLQEFGNCKVKLFGARRELVHNGFEDAGRIVERRKLGPRLIVDSDMPSKDFFLAHAGVLKVRNLDPSLTKAEIMHAFQPFSTYARETERSVEFVYSANGIRSGEAYVGFDVAGDCEDVINEFKRTNLDDAVFAGTDGFFAGKRNFNKHDSFGFMKLGDRIAELKAVQDRKVPHMESGRPGRRPDRATDALVQDLYNWEQHVDPLDLVELEKAGVSKVILDETFRVIRFKNESFGPLDSSLRSESLNPEVGFGEEYKSVVRLYIQTLKECIATPDNVGKLYEMLHFPNEEIDLSVFDEERERQKRLLKQKGR